MASLQVSREWDSIGIVYGKNIGPMLNSKVQFSKTLLLTFSFFLVTRNIICIWCNFLQQSKRIIEFFVNVYSEFLIILNFLNLPIIYSYGVEDYYTKIVIDIIL